MSKVKSRMGLLLTAVMVVSVLAMGCPPPPPPVEVAPEPPPITMLKIATGPIGGWWFPTGAVLATIITEHIEGVMASPTLGGGVVNIRKVNAGVADIGWTHGSSAADAWYARLPFEVEYRNFRAIASMYPTPFHVIVRGGLGIEVLEDLKGRPVGTIAKGHTGEVLFRRVLEKVGITYDDFAETHFVGFADGALLMKDKHIDSYALITMPPSAPFLDVALIDPVDLISFSPEIVDIMVETYGLMRKTIPADTYPGQEHDALTFGAANIFVVRADMDEDLVYRILEEMWARYKAFHAVKPALAGYIMQENALLGIATPLHRGAYRFYVERGFEIPEAARPL